MTEKQTILLSLLRNAPEKATDLAIEVISSFLSQPLSSATQGLACQQELD